MSDKFQLLLKQIRFPEDHDAFKEIKDGSIETVKLFKSKRQWFFVFSFPSVLSYESFALFDSLLHSSFNSLGAKASFEIRLVSTACDDSLLGDYFSYALDSLKVSHFSTYSLFSNLKVEISNNSIFVKAPEHIIKENVQDRFISLISKSLSQVGLSDVSISVVEDKEASSSLEEAYQTNKDSLQEQAESQARQALQSILESAPAPKPVTEPSQNFAEKQSQRQASFDKAEITPMVDINSEENRVVFEGYIFDVEQRETKTGRIIINFKVTDYTSSFAMQRWVKDSDELAKFDMIKKGNWVRVRGRIENNPFTHSLTMNVQDIKEISHTPRKDLMPEGQKRVEFHAHTNMSTMDAMPTVENLIDTAASWGHPAVAITDHANVQSFPHGYHRAKKAGIKAIFGLEANLVEDKVPIVYNSQNLELKEATYVVFDVETTGLSAVHNDLIQIAASKMHKGNIIEQFDEFIDPGHPLSAFTTELTGITDNHVKGAKPLVQVLQEFQEFCQGTVLVAHNATFDVGFMNANYERHQLPTISQPVIDTLEFARNLYPEYKRHGLGPLTKRFGVALDHHHMANYDAEATGRLLFIFIKDVFDKHGLTNLEQLNTDLVSEDSYKKSRVKHATLYVQNQTGLKNIFKLVSLSNVSYFEGVARIPRTVLDEYREGIIVGSACADGEVFDTLLSHGIDKAVEVAKYYDFIEVMPPAIYAPLIAKDLIKDEVAIEQLIRDLIEVANRLDKPVLATGNVHYINPEDAIYREIIVRALGQGAMINRPIGKGENAKPAPLPEAHFRTTNEMLDDFAFLGKDLAYEIVVTNTQAMADQIEEVEVVKKDLYTPFIDRAEEQVAEMTYARAFELYGNPLPDIIDLRIEKELSSILGNGFAVIYLASQMLVNRSNERGYLVGSRGSVGSSFVATMIGITEVNPMPPHYLCPNCQHSEFITDGSYGSGFDLPDKECSECGTEYKKDGQDIPFETFLGFDGDKVPDIDLNFSGDDQPSAHLDVRDIFGEQYAFRAGTVGTVADRTAYGFVKGYERDYNKFYRDAEVDRLAMGAAGVKRNTGQHPGGIVVIPNYMDVYDFTPVQYPADDVTAAWQTTHFNFHDIDENVLKLDILGHDDPTMIRKLQDLSGIDPKDIRADDPDVMKLFSGTDILGVTPEQIGTPTGMLGIPEFGTNFVRGMVDETHPTTFAELLQLSGLSHGTDVWLGNAQDLIKEGIATLKTVIGCRDDIMVYLMHAGLDPKMAFTIMERVRKGTVAKGKCKEWSQFKKDMLEHDVPEWYIWSCERIKYMFPKAHAAAYVMMAYRIAYCKINYPLAYYAAYFGIRASAFSYELMGQGKEKLLYHMKEYKRRAELNQLSKKDQDTLKDMKNVLEMYARGFDFLPIDIYKSKASKFQIVGDKLLPPFNTIDGMGDKAAEAMEIAAKDGPYLSKDDFRQRTKVSKTLVDLMADMGLLGDLPETNQLSLFDFA